MMYAKVIVGLNNPQMDKMFDYGVPEGMKVRQGVRVIVPFGSRNKKEEGYVISLSEETDVPEDKIKNILEMLNCRIVYRRDSSFLRRIYMVFAMEK